MLLVRQLIALRAARRFRRRWPVLLPYPAAQTAQPWTPVPVPAQASATASAATAAAGSAGQAAAQHPMSGRPHPYQPSTPPPYPNPGPAPTPTPPLPLPLPPHRPPHRRPRVRPGPPTRPRSSAANPETLFAFALAPAAALDGVRCAGLLHRDLKPGNIMLTTAGPRLLDFGIAVMLDRTRLTRTGMGIGTLPYMAPEQFGEEPAGPRTDVWAWGCCLVAATSGRSPFQARDTAAILNRVLIAGPDETAIAPLGRLSPQLLDVVRQALTRDPAQRPADGAALLTALLPGAERPPDLGTRITRSWHTLHP